MEAWPSSVSALLRGQSKYRIRSVTTGKESRTHPREQIRTFRINIITRPSQRSLRVPKQILHPPRLVRSQLVDVLGQDERVRFWFFRPERFVIGRIRGERDGVPERRDQVSVVFDVFVHDDGGRGLLDTKEDLFAPCRELRGFEYGEDGNYRYQNHTVIR